MAGALKVGELYVSVTTKLDFQGLAKGVADVAASAKKIGNELKRVGSEAQSLGMLLGGAISAAVAVAGQHNAAVAKELERAKNAGVAFATEIGTMMLPVLKQTADSLGRVVNWFKQLSPETKDQIANWLKIGAGIALVATAIGKIGTIISIGATAVQMLMPLVSGLWSVLVGGAGVAAEALGLVWAALTAPITATIALVAAAIAAVIAIGYLVYEAWTNDWGGIQEKVHAVGEWMKSHLASLWSGIVDTFHKAWSFLGEYILDPFVQSFGWLRDHFFGGIVSLLDKLSSELANHPALAKVAGAFGLTQENLSFFKDVTGWTQHLLTADGMKEIAQQAVDLGATVGSAIVTGAKTAANEVVDLTKKGIDYVKGLVPDLSKFSPDVVVPEKLYKSIDLDYGTNLDSVESEHSKDLDALAKQLHASEELQRHLLMVKELYAGGRIDAKTYYGQLIDYLDQTSESFKLLHDAATAVTSDLAQGFINMANGVQGAFGQMITSILADLERLAANKAFESLLNLGLDALANAFAPTISQGVIGVTPITSALPVGGGFGLRGGTAAVNAPMNMTIHIHSDGSASSDASSPSNAGAQMQRFAKGLKAAVQQHLQDEMRPGGTLYNFQRG
jgi:hypothetical protein